MIWLFVEVAILLTLIGVIALWLFLPKKNQTPDSQHQDKTPTDSE